MLSDFPTLLKKNSQFFTLKTKRLELCLYEESHVKAHFKALHNFIEITEFMAFPSPQKYEETLSNFYKYQDQFENRERINWSIFYEEKFVGRISLDELLGFDMNREVNSAELGYWLLPEFEKKGFMTEAAQEILKFGFNSLLLNKVKSGFTSLNIGSQKVLEKLGFRFIGEQKHHFKRSNQWHDHKIYELLKSDWEKPTIKVRFKNPKRGEVWIVDLGEPFGAEQGGKRPAIILNTPRKKEHTVMMAPSSKTIRSQSIIINNYQFLCFQARNIDRSRLCGKIKRLSIEETNLVADLIYKIIKNET